MATSDKRQASGETKQRQAGGANQSRNEEGRFQGGRGQQANQGQQRSQSDVDRSAGSMGGAKPSTGGKTRRGLEEEE